MLPAPCSGSWRARPHPGGAGRAREQAKASVLMGLESIPGPHEPPGHLQLLYGSVLEQDDILDAYDAVTVPQLRQLAEQIFDFSQLSLSAVGRCPGGGTPSCFPPDSPPVLSQTKARGGTSVPPRLPLYRFSASFPSRTRRTADRTSMGIPASMPVTAGPQIWRTAFAPRNNRATCAAALIVPWASAAVERTAPLRQPGQESACRGGKRAHPQNPQPWEAGIAGAIVVSHKIDRCATNPQIAPTSRQAGEGGHPLPQGRIEKPPASRSLSYGKEQIDHRTVEPVPPAAGIPPCP